MIAPLVLTACGTDGAASPELPVTAAEAAAVLRQVAQLAAQRTTGAATQVCTWLADSCDGMSSRFRADPGSAPETPPSILCDIPLPAIPGQQGPRVLVITGKDAQGRDYVGQVLVLRRHGHPVLQEPAFWVAARYTQVRGAQAWEGASDDAGERAQHDVAVRRACSDPAAFIAAVVRQPTG